MSSAQSVPADFEQALRTCPIVLGGPFGEESFETTTQRLDTFVERGGTVVETAHSYAQGRAETAIGRWRSASSGPGPAIITKIGHPADDGTNDMSPTALRHQALQSRERLAAASLDVVMLHRDDPGQPVAALFRTMRSLVNEGVIRRYGISNWSTERAREFVDQTVAAGDTPILSYQYSLAVPARPIWPDTRHLTKELQDLVCGSQATLLAWAAQARGWFAKPLPTTGADPFDTPGNRRVWQSVARVAAARELPPATIALASVLGHGVVAGATVGAVSVEEVIESLMAADVRLSAHDYEALGARESAPDQPES